MYMESFGQAGVLERNMVMYDDLEQARHMLRGSKIPDQDEHVCGKDFCDE